VETVYDDASGNRGCRPNRWFQRVSAAEADVDIEAAVDHVQKKNNTMEGTNASA